MDRTSIGGLTLNWIESDTILKMDLAYVNPKDSSGLKNYQSILTIFLNKVRYLNTPKTGHLHVNQQPHNIREFETELETVGSIRHRNLVTLHGYALTPYGNLLFYDYMANGSLWDLLHGNVAQLLGFS